MIVALLILTALGCLDLFGLAAGLWSLAWLVLHGYLGVAGALLAAPVVLWAVAAAGVLATRPVLRWLIAEDEAPAADEAPVAALLQAPCVSP